jgi:hypothetical protein
MKIRNVFPAQLSPSSLSLFTSTWNELTASQPLYQKMYLENDSEGRLVDADGLPYTLDALVLEEIDFMAACLRAAPVKKELEGQVASQNGIAEQAAPHWIGEIMKLAVSYSQITLEEEGLWDIDVNIFLSEETSVTANYTSRTACGDLVMKLGEWLPTPTLQGLLSYTKELFTTQQEYAGVLSLPMKQKLTPHSWKLKEAVLYNLNQILCDFSMDNGIEAEIANGFMEYVSQAIQQGKFRPSTKLGKR